VKVVVTGATGNVGTSVLRSLQGDERVREIVGIARRRPALQMSKVTWLQADVAHADLSTHFAGADCVVHLAWLIQPSRRPQDMHRVNQQGTAAVTDAAIAAGVHLVDLGSYYPETLQQLDRSGAAAEAGCRIVIGCGVAPGLTNILARLGADSLDSVESIRMYSYGTHPLSTSPGIVLTRFDVAAVPSLVLEHGRLVERPSFGDEEQVVFPEPYGEQTVYLVPHPEPVTPPRYLDVENVVIKLGYPAADRRALAVLLELGSRGIPDGFRSANAKQVRARARAIAGAHTRRWEEPGGSWPAGVCE
jgi:saccharopine dehydrogenase-like NADP-dependent oxidoreductase